MSWTQAVPLFVTVLTVTGGLFTYLFQKQKDRREDLIKIRRLEYRNWLQSLYDTFADPTVDRDKFNSDDERSFLFASDRVIQTVGEFKHYMATTSPGGLPRDIHKVGVLLAKVVREMRADCFEETKLTDSEIRNLLPIQGVRDDDIDVVGDEVGVRIETSQHHI